MINSIKPDAIPRTRTSNSVPGQVTKFIDPAGNHHLDLVLRSLRVTVASFTEQKISYRKIVRMQTIPYLYVSPFINFDRFQIREEYRFKYKELVYRTIVGDNMVDDEPYSLNKVIIYAMDTPRAGDIATMITQRNWNDLMALCGSVVASEGTADTKDDKIITFTDFLNNRNETMRKEEAIVDIAASGEVTFSVKPSNAFVTDIYLLNAPSSDTRLYSFAISFPLMAAFQLKPEENTNLLFTTMKSHTARFANYRFAILLNPVLVAQDLWKEYEEFKSLFQALISLESSLLDFVRVTDRYSLYKLSNIAAIKRVTRACGRIYKHAALMSAISAKLDKVQVNRVKIFLENANITRHVNSRFALAITSGVVSCKDAALSLTKFFAKQTTEGFIKSALQTGEIYTVPKPSNDEEFDALATYEALYNYIVQAYSIVRPDPLVQSSKLMKEYIQTINKKRDEDIAKLNKKALGNLQDFRKTTGLYIANQMVALTDAISKVVNSAFVQTNPQITAFSQSLAASFQKQLDDLAKAKQILADNPRTAVDALIPRLRPLIKGLASLDANTISRSDEAFLQRQRNASAADNMYRSIPAIQQRGGMISDAELEAGRLALAQNEAEYDIAMADPFRINDLDVDMEFAGAIEFPNVDVGNRLFQEPAQRLKVKRNRAESNANADGANLEANLGEPRRNRQRLDNIPNQLAVGGQNAEANR